MLSEICLQCFDAVGWAAGKARPVKNRGCGCLSGARCRQLYDLHINSMTYTLFLFQIISFKKYFYVSLGNNFLLFCGGPLVVEALGNCPVCPLLNPALCLREVCTDQKHWRRSLARQVTGGQASWPCPLRYCSSMVSFTLLGQP